MLLLCGGLGGLLGWYCLRLEEAYRQEHGPPTTAPVADGPAPTGPESALITLPPDKQAEVNEAVVRGVRFLKARQMDNGCWPGDGRVGFAALPGLTLLEAGVPLSDPNVRKAADYVRAAVPGLSTTYDLSLAILFLDRLGDPKDREHIQVLAGRLLAAQTRTGGWSYTCPILATDVHKQLLLTLEDADRKPDGRTARLAPPPAFAQLGGLPITGDLAAAKPENFKAFEGDNSNTQFGILGLWVARRHKVPVGRAAYLVGERFVHSQTPEGHWTYNPGQVVTTPHAVTCAGLLGLAIARGDAIEKSLTKGASENTQAVAKALTWMGKEIGQPGAIKKGAPPPAPLDYYFLWSLERVAVLYGLKTIEGKDWYGWAREQLLASQKPPGNWEGGKNPGSNPVPDTCLALLTLLQANLARDLTSKLQLLGGR